MNSSQIEKNIVGLIDKFSKENYNCITLLTEPRVILLMLKF